MQSFFAVVVHGGPQVFKIPSTSPGSILGLRPKWRLLLFGCPVNVVAAGVAIDIGERLAGPEFGKATESSLCTLWPSLRMHPVAIVDCKDVRYQDVFDVLFLTDGTVFLLEIFDELSLG
ncbi:MAG: hypothetical protein AB7G35_22080 [Hyphomicrobiaceae bacterium]